MIITIYGINLRSPQKDFILISQLMEKILNVEIHSFGGSGQFDEKTSSISSKQYTVLATNLSCFSPVLRLLICYSIFMDNTFGGKKTIIEYFTNLATQKITIITVVSLHQPQSFTLHCVIYKKMLCSFSFHQFITQRLSLDHCAGAYKSCFAAMTRAGQNIILPDIIFCCPKFGHYIHILPFLDNIFIMGHV